MLVNNSNGKVFGNALERGGCVGAIFNDRPRFVDGRVLMETDETCLFSDRLASFKTSN